MSEFVYVPVEPTEEMLTAAYLSTGNKYYWTKSYFIEGYKAAISAAPTQPSPAESDKEAVRNGGDFSEDFGHENGNYSCQCQSCGKVFKGHKRRVICKLCEDQPAQPAENESEIILNWLIRHMSASELQRIGIPCPPGCTIDDIKQSMKQWKPGDKPKEDQPSEGDVFRALIQYLLGPCRNEEPMGFLHCWNEGDYKGCREWDDIPDILFPKSIRADRDTPK